MDDLVTGRPRPSPGWWRGSMFEADLEQLRVSKPRSSMLEAGVEAASHARCRPNACDSGTRCGKPASAEEPLWSNPA
ncbi:hypothetical protein CCMA1212_002529 [Trichoderma ghanense]|uniref:Uncharacterized protein n=1 Tax=Trichoderma ghanense TaxID=65468 RepID=A0ABY2HCS7_9HYPO